MHGQEKVRAPDVPANFQVRNPMRLNGLGNYSGAVVDVQDLSRRSEGLYGEKVGLLNFFTVVLPCSSYAYFITNALVDLAQWFDYDIDTLTEISQCESCVFTRNDSDPSLAFCDKKTGRDVDELTA